MARRPQRPARPNNPKLDAAPAIPAKAEAPAAPPVQKVADATEDFSAPLSAPAIASILCSFAALAAVILAFSWGPYQVRRHTVAAEAALASSRPTRFAEALPHLLAVTQRFPKAWSRWAQMGDCYLELERGEEALAAYQKSQAIEEEDRRNDVTVKNKPPRQDLQARLGRAHYLLGHYQDCSRLLEGVLKAKPADPEANYYSALIFMKQKEYGKAAFAFQAASANPELLKKSLPQIEEIRAALLGG